ncbi:hypothetical protein M8J77_000457 [Diaphorina citri]|nr:hypothetical protein M8J77_000457 [Diaphorina citri]
MDPLQLQEILNSFQQQQNNFITQLVAQLKPTQPNFSSIVPFENYDAEKEKFSSYLERFQNYCNMKNVTDKGKVAQLLCVSIGSLHYNNLAAFLGPEKPVNKLNLVDLISCFKKLLIPKKNVVVSQHYFLNVFQKDHQNIADFVSSLQRDIVDCEFNVKCVCQKSVSVSDIFLRAQFIRGLRDDWLREQILQSDKTTFEDILVKATALEASKIESKELKQGCSSSNYSNSNTHDINSLSNSRSRSRTRSQSRYPSTSRHKTYSRRSSNSRHVNFRALGIENCCLRCGRNNHKASDCRTDRTQLKCHSCNKQGHVAKVCISTLMSRDKSTNHDTNLVEAEDYSDYSTASYGVNKLESIQQQVVDLFEVSDSDKYLIDVTLNGKVQQFEVDSGAKFSLLSQNEFQNLYLNLPIEESHVAFRSYSGDIIKPVGKLRLKVAYAGKEIIGELHIVPNGHDALLGRQWIRGLGIELKIDSNSTNLAPTLQVQNNKISIDEILRQFSPIFEEKVGCVPVHPWDPPQDNWERLHIDYAGPFENHYFLVCVDAKSKWAEVKIIKDAPNSSNTINLLENIFSVHGYPQVMVSDNASIFQSEEFHAYCSNHGIFQKFIAPGHPATNGLAERNVQTLKHRLKAVSNEPMSMQMKVQNILLRYRATPLSCGKSPAELYLNRKLRIRMDAIFPYRPQHSKLESKPVRSLQVGERVQVRILSQWQFGEVNKKLGNRHYLVTLDSGRTIKRHINQLHSTMVKKKSVSFEPTQSFEIPRLNNSQVPDSVPPIQVPDPVPSIQFPDPVPIIPQPSCSPRQDPPDSPVIPRSPQDSIQPEPRRSQRDRRTPVRFRDYLLW